MSVIGFSTRRTNPDKTLNLSVPGFVGRLSGFQLRYGFCDRFGSHLFTLIYLLQLHCGLSRELATKVIYKYPNLDITSM